jgi:hypothetical protein
MTVAGVHLLYTPVSDERSPALAEAARIVRQVPGKLSIESVEYTDGEVIALDADEREGVKHDSPLSIVIHRRTDSDWRLTLTSNIGVSEMRMSSRPGNVLAELLAFFGQHGAGNWMVVNYDTGEVI